MHAAVPRSWLDSSLLRRYAPGIATAAQVALDLFTILAACAVAWAVWARAQPLPHLVPFADYLPLFVAIALILVLLFARFRMYRLQKTILNIAEFQGVLKAVILCFLLVAFLQFALEDSVIYPRASSSESGLYRLIAELHHAAVVPVNTWSRYVVLLCFLLVFLFVSIERWICFKGLQYLHLRGIGTTNIVIVGASQLGRMLQKRLFLSPRLGYNVVGFLDDDPARVGQAVLKKRVLATTDQLETIVSTYKVGLVLVALSQLDDVRRVSFAETCLRLGIEVAFVPPLFVSDALPPLRVATIETFPLLSFHLPRPSPVYLAFKRAFDIVVAGTGILVNLPLFVILPFLIRGTSQGPALFRQDRVGKDNRRFQILKFRTMHSNLPKYGVSPRSPEDPRLTGIGRWLRRTSVDELPQLINVLKGNMSIVGPRPEMPFIVDGYDAWGRMRLLVKPGMTGLWQISHARDEDIHENLDYDLYYVEHPSITMDLVIVILTVFSVIRGVGAH